MGQFDVFLRRGAICKIYFKCFGGVLGGNINQGDYLGPNTEEIRKNYLQ